MNIDAVDMYEIIIISLINDYDVGNYCCTLYFTSRFDSENIFERLEDVSKAFNVIYQHTLAENAFYDYFHEL